MDIISHAPTMQFKLHLDPVKLAAAERSHDEVKRLFDTGFKTRETNIMDITSHAPTMQFKLHLDPVKLAAAQRSHDEVKRLFDTGFKTRETIIKDYILSPERVVI